jgi:hypothetical protein
MSAHKNDDFVDPAMDKSKLSPSSSYTNIKNLKNIDDEDVEDEELYYIGDDMIEEESSMKKNASSDGLAASFDEKDELIADNFIITDLTKSKQNVEFNRSISSNMDKSVDSDQDVSDALKFTPVQASGDVRAGKSQFYVPKTSELPSYNFKEQAVDVDYKQMFLPEHIYEEKVIIELNNITCLYSSSKLNVELKTKTESVHGRLILTNYKMVFIPNQEHINQMLFNPDARLSLFKHPKYPYSIFIPLSFIYEIRACKYIWVFKNVI